LAGIFYLALSVLSSD